jgi:hypothetical protein
MSSRLRSLNSTKISFFAFQDIITSVSGILILVTLILATELDRPSSRTTHDADPELERQLSDTLRQQAKVDARSQNLQALLAAAETAPVTEKLESDITRLRGQLDEERKKHASLAEQLAASQTAGEARDRALGLTDLKAQIQHVLGEADSLARQEAAVRKEMATLGDRVTSVQSKLLKLGQREGKLWLIPDKTSTTKEPILAVVSATGAKVEQFDHPDQTRDFAKSRAGTDFRSYLAQTKPLDQYVVFLVRPSGIALFDSLVKMARENGFEVGFDALEEDKDVYFSTPPILDETTPPSRRTASEYQPGSGGYSDPKGGAGEVWASGSGSGKRHDKASDADAARRNQGDSASASKGTGKQPGTATARAAPLPAANDRSLWQRFVEWIGFSGGKGEVALGGGTGGSGGGAGRGRRSGSQPGSSGQDAPSSQGDVADDRSRGSARGGSAVPSGPSPTQTGSAKYGRGGTGGGTGTAAMYHGGAAKGTGSGPESGAGSGAGDGTGAGSGAGGGSSSSEVKSSGSGSGEAQGNGATTAKRAAATEGKAETNSPAFTAPKKQTPPPAAQPPPPQPPKPKSWWQRLLEWIGLR